jgi:hypothetical protein
MVPLIRDELVDTSHFLAMIYLGFSYISVTIYHFILKVHFWRVLASRSCFSTFSLGIFQAWSYSTQFSYTLDWRISIDCRVLNYLPNTLTTSTIASYHFFGHDPLFPSTSCHLFLGRARRVFFEGRSFNQPGHCRTNISPFKTRP